MTTSRPRAAVLVSGEGSNLQALIDTAAAGALEAAIVCVVSNRAAARGLDRAKKAGIAALHVGATKGEAREQYDARLAEALRPHRPDFLVLAGFMRIFSAGFVERFAGRMLNIHPSLLPAYPGLDTHRRVLEAGDAWHGATVHFVTAQLDAGPAIVQYRLRVHPDDTAETLAARVHTGEHLILPKAVAWLASGRLRLVDSSVMLDGRPLQQPLSIEEGSPT
jgi:phosphoribosylglycinamide formyltransferase-1